MFRFVGVSPVLIFILQFITFIDPAAALTFFHTSSSPHQPLTLNNRRLKVGWGKNPGPLPPALALSVHAGATRNVYIGNIEDFEAFSEDRLRRDFEEWGEVELVNFLKEKYVFPPLPPLLYVIGAHGRRC